MPGPPPIVLSLRKLQPNDRGEGVQDNLTEHFLFEGGWRVPFHCIRELISGEACIAYLSPPAPPPVQPIRDKLVT